MFRTRSLVFALLLAVLVVASACGSTVQLNNFVGTASCPTAGSAGPYPIPSTNGDPVGQLIDEMPHTHVDVGTKITYNHDPPTSGCHYNTGNTDPTNPAPLKSGAYNTEIPAEQWVHNLEHGFVVVLYNCQAGGTGASDPKNCQADFNTLHDWFKGLPADPAAQLAANACTGINYAKVLVLPWHTMKTKFAVVSWDYYQDLGATLSLDAVKAFYDNHNGQSPESKCSV